MSSLSNGYVTSHVSNGATVKDQGPAEADENNSFEDSGKSPDADAEDESYDPTLQDHADEGSVASETDRHDNNGEHYSTGGSSSPQNNRGAKRKSPPPPPDETEYMRLNPDLYGLRRSTRARAPPQLIQSPSEGSDDAAPPRSKRRRTTASRQSSGRPSPSVAMSNDASETESDEYGPSRARTSKSKRRRHTSFDDEPSYAEVRFSTRNASKVSTYNEDADDSMFEDDADGMMETNWVYSIEDDRPAVEIVLNHRPRDGVEPQYPDVDRNDFEFYIKWQGQSYYHATWETAEILANCRSTRRLDNYIRKVLWEELRVNKDDEAPPEEREKWNLDRERDVEAIEDYKKVERIIGMRDGAMGTEYYVKWKRLAYEGCTWESEDLVSAIAQHEIDRYLDRTSHPPVSDHKESNPATRKSFETIKGTPNFLQNGELKEFQVKGLNFMAFNWVRNRNVVLADEMGLGKTVQTVAFINWLRHVRHQQGPFVVVVPLSTVPSWAETFDTWAPDLNYVVYSGSHNSREVICKNELTINGNPKRPKFNVLLTTYEYVLLDSTFLSQFKWQFMAVDEAHRLKNRDSQLYSKLLEFKAPARLLITGTPIQNNLAELSALLDFLNPGVVDVDADMDLNAEAASQKLAELTKAIQPFMLRRTKSKVETDLPPKTEKIIRVELADVQLEYYKNILTKNYAALNDGAKGQKQSLLNIMIELKKASNHPFMFPNAEAKILEGSERREDIIRAMITSSGKMMLLDQLLAKLKRDGHRVLIFSQMVKMLDILGDYMEVRGYSYQRLDGTISAGSRRLAIDHFNAPNSSDFAFILSTRAGGLGINLMTADTVVLFDSDWNPQADLQAMSRAHRIGQTKPVSVYRLVSKDTVEEEVIERARNKLLLEFITIQRGVTDKEASELQSKMVRGGISVGEPNSTDDISRILKRRGQKMFEQSGNQAKLEQLDIDSVLENAELHQTEQAEGIQADGGEEFLKAFDFVDIKVDDLTWDDIIPKDQLAEIKEEEKRKADERYLAEVIEQNKPRNKRNAPSGEGDSREERKAKKVAKAHVSVDDGDGESDSKSSGQDPKRPLAEKEYRHLLRAFLRYGDLDDHEEEAMREARLVGRDMGAVRAALREITDTAASLVREDMARLEALEHTGKTPTKKEKKAVLFDLHGVRRLNAYTIVERPDEMRILREATSAAPDFRSFRVPEATKAADYSCSWGAREDGMLCVGVARHGYGAWVHIRDDPDLGLGGKLFLEEHRVERKAERMNGENKGTKSPGAVHLVRRADYLLSVLKDRVSNGSSNAAKKARKAPRGTRAGSVSASPAPPSSSARKGLHHNNNNNHHHREPERQRHPHAHSHGPPDSVERTHAPNNAASSAEDGRRRKANNENGAPSREDVARRLFKPIREDLKQVSNVTKENYPDKGERALALRNLLGRVGDFIGSTLEGEGSVHSLEGRLW